MKRVDLAVALLSWGLTGCQLLGQDPARCDQSAATVRQAISFKDFESARKWRDYTWKVCDERAIVATLDKEILDGETALAAEAKAAAQAQQLAQKRINAAQQAWYAYDAGKASDHTQEVLDATRKSAKRLEEKKISPGDMDLILITDDPAEAASAVVTAYNAQTQIASEREAIYEKI